MMKIWFVKAPPNRCLVDPVMRQSLVQLRIPEAQYSTRYFTEVRYERKKPNAPSKKSKNYHEKLVAYEEERASFQRRACEWVTSVGLKYEGWPVSDEKEKPAPYVEQLLQQQPYKNYLEIDVTEDVREIATALDRSYDSLKTCVLGTESISPAEHSLRDHVVLLQNRIDEYRSATSDILSKRQHNDTPGYAKFNRLVEKTSICISDLDDMDTESLSLFCKDNPPDFVKKKKKMLLE